MGGVLEGGVCVLEAEAASGEVEVAAGLLHMAGFQLVDSGGVCNTSECGLLMDCSTGQWCRLMAVGSSWG